MASAVCRRARSASWLAIACGDEKSEQRNPVLRVGDGEGSNRRKKIIIEGERGEHRQKNGEAKSPVRGHPQHHQQKSQRHGGGVHVDDVPVNLSHEFRSHQASSIAEQRVVANGLSRARL